MNRWRIRITLPDGSVATAYRPAWWCARAALADCLRGAWGTSAAAVTIERESAER